MDWSFLCKKCPCWLIGLIKVVSITILTFVIMTIYLQNQRRRVEGYEEQKEEKKDEEKGPDFEQLGKDIDAAQPEEEKKQQERLEEEDIVASTTPFIPDKSEMISPPRPKPMKTWAPISVPPATPPDIKVMAGALFEQVNANLEGGPMTLEDLGVDMSNPRAQELNMLLNEKPSLDDLLRRIEANRPKYGLITTEAPPPSLDEIAAKLNAFFITQTEFVDVVKSSAFFRTMSKADLIARQGIDTNTKEPSADVYYATYISSYQPFSNEQKYKLIQAVQTANNILKPYPVLNNIKWRFAKIKNGMEKSYPHTLKDVIMTTEDFLNIPLNEVTKTLIHEKFHVYQRQFSDSITQLVSRLEFVPLTSSQVLMIDYVLRALMRNNPDLDGAIYMYKPSQKVIAQLYNTTEPKDLADSRTVQLALNSFGRNSELLRVTNESLGLPNNFTCQLEHPYEITACIVTELITNPRFYNSNKNNKHVKTTVDWINSYLMR